MMLLNALLPCRVSADVASHWCQWRHQGTLKPHCLFAQPQPASLDCDGCLVHAATGHEWHCDGHEHRARHDILPRHRLRGRPCVDTAADCRELSPTWSNQQECRGQRCVISSVRVAVSFGVRMPAALMLRALTGIGNVWQELMALPPLVC